MSRRRMMSQAKSELPSGYVRCKYLESSGKQWIDTGYIPTINTDIKTRASVVYSSTIQALFGYLRGSNPYNRYSIQYQNTTIYCSKGNTETSIDSIAYTKMCDIETQGSDYIYDGKTISVAPLDFSVENTLSIILFARTTSVVSRHSKAKMEFFEIYEIGRIAMNLITAIDPSGRPCMYDTVTQQPFYSQGTGEFGYELLDGTYVAPT